MRLRMLRTVLLLLPVLLATLVPVAHAQNASEAELKALNARVLALYNAGKYGEAIPLAERYAAAMKARHGEYAPEYAAAMNNLAQLLQDTNRLTEAEPLMRRALAIDEKAYGSDHSKVAVRLNNLAALLQATNRLAEAEPLMRRALAINEKSFGANHSSIAIDLNNLAKLLQDSNRLAEAELLMRRALAIDEKSYGPDHPKVAIRLNDLAQLLAGTKRFAEAEPLYRRALAIAEKSNGPDHPNVATVLNNLAQLLAVTNRLAEAEPLLRRAIAIDEKSYGPDYPKVAIRLYDLAQLLAATNRLAEAETLMRRTLAIDEKSYGPDHPKVAIRLNDLAQFLASTNRFAEAEPLMRRALAIAEKAHGRDHTNVAIRLYDLAQLLAATNRFAEAEPLMRRALAIAEKTYGPDHPNVATVLNNLASLLADANRHVEAEPLMRRALTIDEKAYGPDHPKVAIRLNDLAQLRAGTNHLAEAEPLMRRALTIDEKAYGPNHPNVAIRLNNLASLLADTNHLAEAEQLKRRALAIFEKAYGPDHPEVAMALNNLATLLKGTNRLAEAEPLMRRALAIAEKAYGPDHRNVATALSNLAGLLNTTNRFTEAEPLMRRALAIFEKAYGPDHPNVAMALNNLAALLADTNRLADAEPLMRRALAIAEKSYGPDHPNVATALNNLATLLNTTNRLGEVEPLTRRALTIDEKSYGPEHPKVARDLNNLATLREEQNDWTGAAALCLRAKPIMTATGASAQTEDRALTKAALTQNTGDLRNCARAHYRANRAANIGEGFALAQWAMQNAAADAVSAMSLRFAKGDIRLAQSVREVQDLLSAKTAAYRRLDAAAGKADTEATEEARATVADIERQLAVKQTALRRDFPEYAALANPQPLAIAETQALLSEDQALVVFLDMWDIGNLPGETLVFVLTKREARWLSIPLDRQALRSRVTALRCGLDGSNWRPGRESREVCKKLLNTEASENARPPFDAATAHTLYRDLFGGVEDLIKNKSLLIVASGPLTQLPFEALVTRAPDKAQPRFEAYKGASWLGQSHAITILPSVGSLKGLRTAKSSEATAPFIGFGNPLLTGADGTNESAWAKQTCAQATAPKDTRTAEFVGNILSFFRGGTVDVAVLRQSPPLPETADELCAVATGLGVASAEMDKSVQLGSRATVTQVKAMSASGALARARVIHFATHGLLAGETALFAKHHAEPSLLLTPPDHPSAEDNGLLTASEVAQLKLDADWVIMSACNTAAGDGESAEALSGLARAFFYAGARSLLVSHWPVNSSAAVKITTRAINEMKANPKLGRAEALRRSISTLIAKGEIWDHPSIWAPFVLVGNGGQ